MGWGLFNDLWYIITLRLGIWNKLSSVRQKLVEVPPSLFQSFSPSWGRQAAGILGCIWLSEMWWRYLPVWIRRCPSTFLGRHCLEPSPWRILFGSMSIRLNIGLIEWCLVEDAGCLWNWCCKWIACAGVVFGYGPLHTHFTHIHSHKLVAMLRCEAFTANSSSQF